jgi:hypothetical protein
MYYSEITYWFFLFSCTFILLSDRAYFEAVYIDRKVYAISTFSRIAAGTVECFDIDANKWSIFPSLPYKLRSLAATAIGSTIFVIGGIDIDSLERSNRIYFMNVADEGNQNWAIMPSKLIIPRYRHSAVTAPDGRIWIAGGIILQVD